MSSPAEGTEPSDPLGAPCVFCGYNGQGYWQSETHTAACPWRAVGGAFERHIRKAHSAALCDQRGHHRRRGEAPDARH